MILLIALQAISGLFIHDDIYSSGPYYGSVSDSIEKIMSIIHHNAFDFMIVAIFMHVGAVLYYWLIKKQNLILPMITGKKSAIDIKKTDVIPNSKIPLAIIVTVLAACFVYWLVVINVPEVEAFYY